MRNPLEGEGAEIETGKAATDDPVTSPDPPAEISTRRMMIGAMLVMGACVFGGLTAVVLMALGQRGGAIIVAVIAGVVVVAGVAIQVMAFRRTKVVGQEGTK